MFSLNSVTSIVDGVLIEPNGLKCYCVNEGERFKGFVFAHNIKEAELKAKSFGRGYVIVGFGFAVSSFMYRCEVYGFY